MKPPFSDHMIITCSTHDSGLLQDAKQRQCVLRFLLAQKPRQLFGTFGEDLISELRKHLYLLRISIQSSMQEVSTGKSRDTASKGGKGLRLLISLFRQSSQIAQKRVLDAFPKKKSQKYYYFSVVGIRKGRMQNRARPIFCTAFSSRFLARLRVRERSDG
jgi:hypothetical protein